MALWRSAHGLIALSARIAALAALRKAYPALRFGRQYPREISFLGRPFSSYGPGEIVAWSRILDDEELLCVLNSNGLQARGADVVVDAALNAPGHALTVVLIGYKHAEQADFPHFLGQFFREGLFFIEF